MSWKSPCDHIFFPQNTLSKTMCKLVWHIILHLFVDSLIPLSASYFYLFGLPVFLGKGKENKLCQKPVLHCRGWGKEHWEISSFLKPKPTSICLAKYLSKKAWLQNEKTQDNHINQDRRKKKNDWIKSKSETQGAISHSRTWQCKI